MVTAADVYNGIAPTAGTPANSFELGLAVQGAGGGSYVILPDIVNLDPKPSDSIRSRQTYAFKGANNGTKYSQSIVVTVDVEIVRDANGQWQPALQDLYLASTLLGTANKRNIQVFDLLGGVYAVQTQAAVGFTFSGTGWDDSKFATLTLTGNGLPTYITNPVLVGAVPAIGSVLPLGQGATKTVVINGDQFTGATGVTVGGTAATGVQVLGDSQMLAILPTGASGSAPIIVTGPAGASTPFGYTRAT